MKNERAGRRGFTLAELMVVIVIIGVLMALLLPAVLRARERSRFMAAKTKMNSVSAAIDAFQRDFGAYPPTLNAFNADPVTGGAFNGDPYGDFGYAEALVQCLCNRFTKGTGDPLVAPNLSLRGYDRVIGMAPVTAGPYLEVKAQDIIDRDQDGFPELADPWQNAYIYVPNGDYFEPDGVTYRAGAGVWTDADADNTIDPDEFQHYQRFKFQLISLGTDGWTLGLYYPLEPPRIYRYFDITFTKAPNFNPSPYLVGTDDDLSNPATDVNHPDGTADDLNNWR